MRPDDVATLRFVGIFDREGIGSALPAMRVSRERRIGLIEGPRTGLAADLDRIAAELDLYGRGIELAVASRTGSCRHGFHLLAGPGLGLGWKKAFQTADRCQNL
jgi:hypothetical protein